MDGATDQDMERLLQKYEGRRIPPLVDVDGTAGGLLDQRLLQVYHQGLISLYALRLRILLAQTTGPSSGAKWAQGDYWLNEDFSTATCGIFCQVLHKVPARQSACQSCDRRWAVRAEQAGASIAYMCESGLIDFASPVSILGKTVAVLFSGPHKISPGAQWNPELVWPNGQFRPLKPEETGIDAWLESERRIRAAETCAGYAPRALANLVHEDTKASTAADVTPERTLEIVTMMQATAEQLGKLATLTLEVEKSELIGWLREQVVRSLMPLGVKSVDADKVWRQLGVALQHVARYFGLDYVVIVSCRNSTHSAMTLLAQCGLPEGTFPTGESHHVDPSTLSRLKMAVCDREQAVPLAVKEFREIPLFEWLTRKRSARALAVPLRLPPGASETTPIALLAGRFTGDADPSGWTAGDRVAFDTIISDVSLVAAMVVLAEFLREQSTERTKFMEDVAHDLRNPLQIIMSQAEILAADLAPERRSALAHKLATQARRLDHMSQRIWTLQNLDRGAFQWTDMERVPVYQVINVARKDLADIADARRIKVSVDEDLAKWPAVRVHKVLFYQAVLNLMDNAIKYSRQDTEVRIDGKRTADGEILSFTNRGIQIRDEDRARVFERYYRANEAKTYRQEGTGIGLAIVKAFADAHGDVSVKCRCVPNTLDYVTTFELLIRERNYADVPRAVS